MPAADVYRILDANFNRCREGLRVCEEVVRFSLNDKTLTAALKKARHAVTAAMTALPEPSKVLAGRNVKGDVGKEPSALENKRGGLEALFAANIQRSKESLRVLEETVKLVDAASAATFKKIRFTVYAVEKRTLPKLESLRDHGREIGRRQTAGRDRGGRHRGRSRRRPASR